MPPPSLGVCPHLGLLNQLLQVLAVVHDQR